MNEPLCGECTHYIGSLYCRKRRYTEGKHDTAICPDFERENESMKDAYIYQGDNYHHCVDCGLVIKFGDMVFRGKWGYRCYTCQYYLDKRNEKDMDLCSQWALKRFPERETMSNIKITAEVNGKQVPLKTISAETFEAIKALEKPKEIPVARVGNWRGSPGDRRLFLRINEQLRETIVNNKYIRRVTIDLEDGNAVYQSAVDSAMKDDLYENIITL